MRRKTKGPLMLLSMKDRDNRPKEMMFSEWAADVDEMTPRVVKMMGEMGLEMSELDVMKYLAWSAETAIARLAWALGDEMRDMAHIMSSLADDVTRRYVAYRKGAYEAPAGWPKFDTPQEYEAGLVDHGLTRPSPTAVPASNAPDYVPGGYL